MENILSLLAELDFKFNTHLKKHMEIIRTEQKKSFLSEIKALSFFDKHFALRDVIHDSDRKAHEKITSLNKTPDWFFNIHGQKVMIEVYNQNINEINLKRKEIAKIGEFVPLEIKDDRLRKGNLSKKYFKYNELVQELNIPYFLFIDVDFLGDIDSISLYQFLYGSTYEDITNIEFTSFYQEYMAGYYYDERFKENSKYINGFFLLKDGVVEYFHNYGAKIQLSDNLKNSLLKFQCKDE